MYRKIIFLFLTCIAFSGCFRSEKNLKQAFIHPENKFRMNQNIHNFPMDEMKQDSLIQKYLNNGYGGLVINAPFDNYLTEEGMKATKSFCDKAKKANMDLWLYDEKGYPSGNAGDLVIKDNPEWEGMGLYMRDTLVQKGGFRFLLPPGNPELIAAYPVINDQIDYKNPTDLTASIINNYLNWVAPEGSWKILTITKYRIYEFFQAAVKGGGKVGANYPSLMIPEVTEKFIKVTHQRYADYLGDDLGKYFVSTFTDEPSLQAIPFGQYNWAVIPWQTVLSDEIEQRYGYRPEEKLVELFEDQGPEGQKVRYQYFQTVGDLISHNYFNTIKEWCHEHNFKSGGHLLLEETMMAHVPLYGNIMECYRELDAPGIDILSCFPEKMPVHSPKLASSAAELTGSERVMSEPCPVADRIQLGGKETPAESVRGFLNMLMLGGVTDFNNYLQLSNSDSKEKNEFNTYVGRIAMMLRGGITKTDVGIVYPIESLWTEYLPKPIKVAGWDSVAGGAANAIKIEQCFRNISRYMFAKRWEYSYLDSKAIMDSELKKSSLQHNKLSWDILILPSVSTLPAKAWDKLEGYIREGGKIIALETMPLNTESIFPDEITQKKFKNLFDNYENAVFLQDWDTQEIEKLLRTWKTKTITLDNESAPIRYAHKIVNKKDVFFIINDSDKTVNTLVTLDTKDKLEEWNPADGTVKEVENSFEINLKAYHGKLYRKTL